MTFSLATCKREFYDASLTKYLAYGSSDLGDLLRVESLTWALLRMCGIIPAKNHSER